MDIRNGMVYKDHFGRAAAYFLGTCAPPPQGNTRLPAYELITGIYKLFMEDASLLGYKPLPDTYLAPFEKQKGREKDIRNIRGAVDKIEAVIAELYALVASAQPVPQGLRLAAEHPRIGRALKRALSALGVTLEADGLLALPQGCAEGLRELADISFGHTIPITDGPKEDKAYLYFSRAVLDPKANWTAMAFDRLLGTKGELLALCDALEKRGYRRIDCGDGKRIGLDYVKQHGKKNEPVKKAWAERTHAGIELSYEELQLEPATFWLRMPMYRIVLENADALQPDIRQFLSTNTKTCDGCRYCVQTDKTGQRPLAAIRVVGKPKCPYFPGFSMNWRRLSPGFSGAPWRCWMRWTDFWKG